jgi:F-type H+-transporting ATPase subunit delta
MRSDVAAGYKITVEDLQLDATIENQLKRFEETVLN